MDGCESPGVTKERNLWGKPPKVLTGGQLPLHISTWENGHLKAQANGGIWALQKEDLEKEGTPDYGSDAHEGLEVRPKKALSAPRM